MLNGYELSIVGSQVAVSGPDATVARSLARKCCRLLNSHIGVRWRMWLSQGDEQAIESVRQQMLAWLSAEEAGADPEPADDAIRRRLSDAGLPVAPGTSERLARRRLEHYELAQQIARWQAEAQRLVADDQAVAEAARAALRCHDMVRELHTLTGDETFRNSRGSDVRLRYLSDHYPKLLAALVVPARLPLRKAS